MIVIRTAQSSDFSEIAKIEAESYPAGVAASLEDFRSYLADQGKLKTVLVADEADGAVGFLGYAVHEENCLYIWDIAVRQAYRSRGIATRLLASLIERASAQKAQTIFLKVSSENMPARHLYARFNFQEKERIENYYGSGQDAVVLELTI